MADNREGGEGGAQPTAETLFALASAPGRAAIAVWRLSGPRTRHALRALTGKEPPPPRQAALRALSDPESGAPLDHALVLFFPGPASFTGEDAAELQAHGGRAVAEAMASALGRLPGLRAAEPGEFSRRAFVNGKLDLTAAEAIADLTAAETEAQRRQALAQAGGALAHLYEGWRETLIGLRARMDAALEFPDEDVGDPLAGIGGQIAALRETVAAHVADARRGERLREGMTIAVVGAPNAGKSSLVNAFARREVAIVSPEAGTTRDLIEVHLDLGGYPVVLVDTAGLRDAESPIEAEGIARARARADGADLVLALFASDATPDAATLGILDSRAIVAISKSDLGAHPEMHLSPAARRLAQAVAVSAKTAEGIPALLRVMTDRVAELVADNGRPPPTRERHREALRRCLAALDRALAADAAEISAEELRRAGDELGRITGRIDIEQVLDSIFLQFCIGK